MRFGEKKLVEAVRKWTTSPSSDPDTTGFVKGSWIDKVDEDGKETGTGSGGGVGWIWDKMRLRRT